MRSKYWKKYSVILLFLAAFALALSGCSGSDGAAGPAGANGTNGLQGPAGPVTLTQESCLVCHNQSDVANVSRMHDFTFNTTTGSRTTPRLNEKSYAATITKVEATAANNPKITFNVKLDGANFTTLTAAYLSRIIIADQVPANTGTNKFGSPYWENWAYETGASGNPTSSTYVANPLLAAGGFDDTDKANGNYSVTLPIAFGATSAKTSTLATASNNCNNADYSAAHVQRVYLRVITPSLVATTNPGGVTQAVLDSLAGVGAAAAILDFNVPAAGATAVKVDTQNQYVTIDACRKCHGPQLNGAAHGNGYVDTLACVNCHSPLSGTGAKAVYLPKFIHEIHAALPVAEFPTRILGAGYKDVTYPQPIKNCVVCHTATTAQKTAMGTGNKIDNWKTNPTIEICGSCHEKVDFVTGVGHTAGPRANGSCIACHNESTIPISTSHAEIPAAKDEPEYDVTMNITAPTNGTHYVTNETPTVTLTLKDHVTGLAVPGTVYTTAKHAAGTFSAASLSKASLYVYGPRANAKPVLTKAAATISTSYNAPTQAQPLFVDATNAAITTSAAGFSYKLTIPAGMTAGTYMVRFIAANYGFVSEATATAAANYKIDSTAFKTIQIGTATPEQRIAGSAATDTCTDCHGNNLFEPHNARHSVAFSANTTDECNSCHDKSGNHAQLLAVRVHAIHGASKGADVVPDTIANKAAGVAPEVLDWSKITYPQGIPTVSGRDATTGLLALGASAGAPRCITCHTGTGTSGTGVLWKTTSVSQNSCKGCHNDKRGAKDHFLQNGGR